MLKQIYPSELHLNKANATDTEAPFLDLHLTISGGFVSSNIYDKRDDFYFDIVNFPSLDGDITRHGQLSSSIQIRIPVFPDKMLSLK